MNMKTIELGCDHTLKQNIHTITLSFRIDITIDG